MRRPGGYARAALLACAAVLLALALAGDGLVGSPAHAQETAGREVRLKRLVVVITGADPVSDQVLVMEKLLLQNDGQTPYEPAQWENSVVRVRFPRQATELSLDAGPPGVDLVPVPGQEGTYALAAPLPTGEQTLVVSYALPYSAASVKVPLNPAMPAEIVQVLLPAGSGLELRAANAALRLGEELTIGSQRYALLEGKQLAPGTDATFELRGLVQPDLRPAASNLPGGALAEAPLIATAALLLGAALVYGVVQR